MTIPDTGYLVCDIAPLRDALVASLPFTRNVGTDDDASDRIFIRRLRHAVTVETVSGDGLASRVELLNYTLPFLPEGGIVSVNHASVRRLQRHVKTRRDRKYVVSCRLHRSNAGTLILTLHAARTLRRQVALVDATDAASVWERTPTYQKATILNLAAAEVTALTRVLTKHADLAGELQIKLNGSTALVFASSLTSEDGRVVTIMRSYTPLAAMQGPSWTADKPVYVDARHFLTALRFAGHAKTSVALWVGVGKEPVKVEAGLPATRYALVPVRRRK